MDLTEYINCHMYPDDKPKESSLVYVIYRNYTDTGVVVSLPEYNDIEALLMYTEVARKKYTAVGTVCPIGGKDVLEVLSVTSDYIDLSRKHIRPDDRDNYLTFYKSSHRLHTILKKIAVKHKIPVIELYQDLIWPLYDSNIFPDGENHPVYVLRDAEVEPTTECRKAFLAERERLFGKKSYEIRQNFELECHELDGSKKIRTVLSEMVKNSDIPIRIITTTVPTYQILVKGEDLDRLTEKAIQTVDLIKQSFSNLTISELDIKVF